MSIRLGTTDPSSFRLGNTAVSRIMLGVTEVWSAVDADAADYFARIASAGSSISSSNQAAVNAFIVGCKADGIWSAIKASCLLCAADSLAGALVPLVGTAPTNNGFVSGDYSRTTGLIGNGSSKYLVSNRNNNADPQDSHHQSLWVNSAGLSGRYAMGAGGIASGSSILGTGGGVRSRSLTLNSSASSPTNFFGASRSSASGYTIRASSSNYAITQTSQTPYNGDQNIFMSSNGAGLFSSGRYSFYSIGESLNLSLLDARLVTLMAALT